MTKRRHNGKNHGRKMKKPDGLSLSSFSALRCGAVLGCASLWRLSPAEFGCLFPLCPCQELRTWEWEGLGPVFSSLSLLGFAVDLFNVS